MGSEPLDAGLGTCMRRGRSEPLDAGLGTCMRRGRSEPFARRDA